MALVNPTLEARFKHHGVGIHLSILFLPSGYFKIIKFYYIEFRIPQIPPLIKPKHIYNLEAFILRSVF
jgi:hypothetical protein